MAPIRAPTPPAQRYYIPPEGGALKPPVRRSRSQAEPWQPRAERPGGWLNLHARKGVSTFGNTASHRFFTKAHGFPAAAGGKKMAPKAPYLPSGAVLYTSRGRKPSTRPGGVSRSRTEPLAPRAKGPAAPSTLARESGRQPSGILESTAPVPIPTAPQAPEPSRP